ncbi:B12-binding domain-containing radical SAM protein, partial [Acidobacteria bacterium AH-259-O06]|nr:B12-binding domain-containing radical SAM protein [Acidobacteria bacterium AH-259-O06]
EAVTQQIRALREEMAKEFRVVSRLVAGLLGPVVWWTTRHEEKRLLRGKTYEPKNIIDRRNWVSA